MRSPFRPPILPASLVLLAGGLTFGVVFCFTQAGDIPKTDPGKPAGVAAGKVEPYWRVEDVRPGMKGFGRTVMKGTKVETFQAEVLGVLKNTSPGRDMVLCRLSGLGLERSGIIAGMSGSPVYIDNKLLGAVAFGWAYGKDPIGGITPFCQMHDFVESYERRDLAEQNKPRRVGVRHSLPSPIAAGDKLFDSVTVSQDFSDESDKDGGLWLRPLRTPLAASGMSLNSLKLLGDATRGTGLVPLQGGAATSAISEEAKNVALEPGGPLSISLITGDFDLSGIGTVTHIEGKRVYGWGHPFMSLGECEFPLMTGYIHTIYPRQSVSFKMGSPLRPVGVINADVSTCIAGWLDKKPDMMPMRMTVGSSPDAPPRTFNVEVARQKSLLASLVFTALVNSIDMEGDLPEELTAKFKARIELEDGEPLKLEDTFSGFSGGRAPSTLYSHVASVVSLLVNNPYKPVRIRKIECDTTIQPGRRAADIEAVEPESEVYAPGETVRVRVYVRPWKGDLQRINATLKLPADLPEGSYTATLSDDVSAIRSEMRDSPSLSSPQNLDQVMASVRALLKARRTQLAVRLSLGATGVAMAGKEMPNLPDSMVQILGNSRRTGSQTIRTSLVERHPTEWVLQGQETVSFRVTKNKKVTPLVP